MRTLLPLAAATLILAAAALPAHADDVEWTSKSYEEVLEEAKATGRFVLIDFYTLWCGPCKKLDRETYTNTDVLEFIDGMIPLKLDSEKGEGIAVSKRHRVSHWPTIMLLDSDGVEIDRIVGFVDAEEFIQTLSDYQQDINTVAYFERKIEKDPDDAEAWKTLGSKYAYSARGEEANAAFEKYLSLTPELTAEEKAETLYSIGESFYIDRAYDQAVTIFERILAEYSDSERRDPATTLLARSYFGLGEVDKCIAIYGAFIEQHLDDAKACNSFAWFCATKKVGLDEALPVALRAVELSERSAVYLDTLAELYFARGEFEKAIEIGREARDKEPEDPYFAEQLEKFEAAHAQAKERARR